MGEAEHQQSRDPFSQTPPGSRRIRKLIGSRPQRRNVATRSARTGARMVWTVVFAPVFFIYLLREVSIVLKDSLTSFSRSESTPSAPQMTFRRPDGMPEADDRSVADVVETLESYPFEPRDMSGRAAFLSDSANDGISVLLGTRHHWSGLPHMYPSEFQPRLFTGAHGEQISALEALHDSEGPAIIISHGLFTSKHFDYIRRVATRMFFDWGFHVVTMDLRGHGQTLWTSGAPSSAGYYEGADLVEMARELKQDPRVTSVGVLGYSLGAGTALNAARHASNTPDTPIDGGVIALSAPTDMGRAVEYVSTRPSPVHPFFPLWLIYWAGLRVAIRDRRIDQSLNTWIDMMRGLALPYYGLSEEELFEQASAVEWADEIKVPTLDLHAADDFVVPVDHAFAFADAAEDNGNVHVWVVDKGSHISFPTVDPRWFRSVVRRWFEYWATEPPSVRSVD